MYHVPVMVREVVGYLRPERGGLYFDGTLGGGGHSAAILEAGAGARVIGVDRDPEAVEAANRVLARFGERVKLVLGNFAEVAEKLEERLAGALLDLGLSSRQLDEAERGFSFRPGVPLDMRMSGPGAGTATAADLLNELPERELEELFRRWGEERRAGRLAAEVVKRRRRKAFETSDDLVSALRVVFGARMDAQDKARIFQALRIAVNEELLALERALPALRDRLEAGGVLVVLSYHSLEDRRVKEAFRDWSRRCVCPPELPVCRCRGEALGRTLTRKPVYPDASEVAANPRARSARLRAWEKAA